MFSPANVLTSSVTVAFPVSSTGTVISSVPPTNVAPPPGEPTVKLTVSGVIFRKSSRLLSTKFP